MGYDTNLKVRRFAVGDLVARYHEPLVGIKLRDNWDGPWRITQRVSDDTVLMRDTFGRNQKSNVARLKPWKGREYSTEMFKMGQEEKEEMKRELDKVVEKRGPGRPRKVKKETVQVKRTPKRSEKAKNVSAGVDRKRRPVPSMAKRERKQTAPNVRCKENPVGVRRSPRLRVRGAVT